MRAATRRSGSLAGPACTVQSGSPRRYDVPAPDAGYVCAIDGEAIGLAAMALGAGRSRVEDRIDHAVGLVVRAKVGDRVRRGDPLCTVHAGPSSEPDLRVAARILGAYRLGSAAPPPRPLVLERIAS